MLAVVDANGAVVERYEYDAWGKVLSVTDTNRQQLSRSAIGNRILWQGREYSWTTGLYYFRNRWYGPTIGRWISKDPIGINGGLNVYAFCGNDPINRTDPSGLFVGGIVSRKVGWSRVIITDVKGKQVTLTNHGLEDFRDTILAYDNQSIADITIYDHGSVSEMNIDGNAVVG